LQKELTIEAFIDYLTHEQRAQPQTVSTYESHLRHFQQWMQQQDESLTWNDVDTDMIREWMSTRMDEGMKAKSIKARLSALRSFFRFALRRQLVKTDPSHLVASPKVPKPLPMFVREKEMDSLLDDTAWDESLKSLLQRAIVTMLYETGLRCGELCSLNNADVDTVQMQLRVTGKGDKTRVVPFGRELADAVVAYQQERDRRQQADGDALFLSTRGRRISRRAVYQLTHDALSTVTSLPRRSPHVLRHSYATAMLNHGAQLEGVRRLLGHANLDATEIYTHATFEQLRRAYKKAHPREEPPEIGPQKFGSVKEKT